MNDSDLLRVVVLNWNGGEANLRCLAALTQASITARQVVFVDNASSDGSMEAVLDAYPEVTCLRQGQNLGFCAGMNAGLQWVLASPAAYVLVLNNDVEVAADFLAPLLRAIAAPRVAAVGPKVLLPGAPARIWCAGGRIDYRANVSTLLGHGELDRGQYDMEERVDYLPGCALLLRTEVLREVGCFDEQFFAYMEDVDLGLRLRKQGWESRYVPSSRVVHEAGSSSGGGYAPARKYANALNSVRFLRKHSSLRGWMGLLLFDLCSLPVAWMRELLRGGNPAAVLAKARGLLHGFLGRRVEASSFERARAARLRKSGAPS